MFRDAMPVLMAVFLAKIQGEEGAKLVRYKGNKAQDQ